MEKVLCVLIMIEFY